MTMSYDLLLTGARVLDPSRELDDRLDVGIHDGRISAIGKELEGCAEQQIDLAGRLLTAGWIDIHAHVYAGATTWGVSADAICLATGVTTIVDAGSPGWANLPGFLEFIVAPARTRVLTFVHVSGIGLTYGPLGECEDMRYVDSERTAAAIERWRDVCVGIKVRQGGFQVDQPDCIGAVHSRVKHRQAQDLGLSPGSHSAEQTGLTLGQIRVDGSP